MNLLMAGMECIKRNVALLALIVGIASQSSVYAEPVTDASRKSAQDTVDPKESEELPISLQRLFGESIPFPEPETTGFELYALAMHDVYANTTGGEHKGGGIIGNFFLSLTIDTEKAGWWDGGKFVLEGIGVYGRQPVSVIGDYQYTSSIDAPDGVELYELFYEHSFLDGRLTWLAGVHDYSLEFAVAEYGWDFIHSSFWSPSTMTQYWWSFYPTTGLGSRAKLKVSETGYLMAGVYDGNATDQDNIREIDWTLSKKDGAHTLVELGVAQSDEGKRPYKLAIGGWYNSGEYQAADGGLMHANSGTYLVGQTMLAAEDETYQRGLGGFVQVGQADNTRNFNSWYFGAGLRYKGLLPARTEDILGIAWGRSEISGTYRAANPGYDSFEGDVELTYRSVIRPWITIQPSVQLITNPGAISEYDDAVVLFVRSEVLL